MDGGKRNSVTAVFCEVKVVLYLLVVILSKFLYNYIGVQ